VSNNDEVTSQALYIQNCSGKETEEVGFQPICKDVKRRRISDVLWQIVPDTSSGDREGSIADGGKLSSADTGTISDEGKAERSRCRASRSAGRQSSSMRYSGANPCTACRHLYMRTASLKSIRSQTFSQWSRRRTGVTSSKSHTQLQR